MKLVYVVNADWYFCLHWLDRAVAAMKNGYDVYVISPETSEKYTNIITEAGCKKIHLKLSRSGLNPAAEIATLFFLSKQLKQIQPDLIHSITVKPNLYCGLISKFNKLPLIASVTGLGLIYSDNKYQILRFLISSLYRFIFKGKTNKVLFESQDDLNLFVSEKIIDENMAVKVNGAGVNTALYSPNCGLDWRAKPLVFVFAARLLHSKGVMELVKAFNLLDASVRAEAKLIVAGIEDVGSKDSLSTDDMELLKTSDGIEYIGRCDDMPVLLQNAHVVCLPTTYGEGIPRILIEAASCGKVILTSDLGGCKEICISGFNGIALSDVSACSLSEAISMLVSNRALLLEYGTNGRKLVLDKFDQELIIEQNLSLYKDLVSP